MTPDDLFMSRVFLFLAWFSLVFVCLSPSLSREVFLKLFGGKDCKRSQTDHMIKNNGGTDGKSSSTKSIHEVA